MEKKSMESKIVSLRQQIVNLTEKMKEMDNLLDSCKKELKNLEREQDLQNFLAAQSPQKRMEIVGNGPRRSFSTNCEIHYVDDINDLIRIPIIESVNSELDPIRMKAATKENLNMGHFVVVDEEWNPQKIAIFFNETEYFVLCRNTRGTKYAKYIYRKIPKGIMEESK